jgi:nicotinamidase-related amidase
VLLPAEQTALIVLDMQNDFVKPGGNLVVPTAIDTVGNIQRLLYTAREHHARVIYTQDTQIKDDPEFEVWPEHCKAGTWGWEIIDELAPLPGEPVMQKNRYDGHYQTAMDHFLSRIWHVDNVVIVGTVANICVLHTAASAGLRYLQVTVPANGISVLTELDQALTLRQIGWLYAGNIVRSVDDIEFA